MKLKVQVRNQGAAGVVAIRCPHCGKNGSFEVIGKDMQIGKACCGQRCCPDPTCQGHVFVVVQNNQVVACYPPARVEFDSANIPPAILASFEEALDTQAHGLYRSSAMMVRRTLEEICADKNAAGPNLAQRLQALGSTIILPQELLTALNELRLLGNDAAHIDAKTFAQVSKQEVDAAVELTKEILKAIYQYSGLLDKLRALKQP